MVHWKISNGKTPKRGDIIVFRWPPNTSYDFIKRVVGVPGDKISYENKTLTINGQPINQILTGTEMVNDEDGPDWLAKVAQEDLMGVKHQIYLNPERQSDDYKDITVPPHMYFVMGDNRDDSADSRYWGFVPEQNIVGKAELVWMSWNNTVGRVRWNRIGELIK